MTKSCPGQKKSAGKCNGYLLQWELPLKPNARTALLPVKRLPLTKEPGGDRGKKTKRFSLKKVHSANFFGSSVRCWVRKNMGSWPLPQNKILIALGFISQISDEHARLFFFLPRASQAYGLENCLQLLTDINILCLPARRNILHKWEWGSGFYS